MVARIAPPTTPFNAVMPRLDIPEKAYIVGAETGKIHAQLGDNPNGPETVTITPPGGSPTRASIGVPAGTPRGAQSFATGGSLTVGSGLDPNDPNIQAQIASGDVYFDPSSNSIQSRSGYSSPVTAAPQAQAQGAPAPVANTATTDPLEAQRQAQQAAIDARGGVAAATGAVNAAKGAVVPLTQAQINANAGVVGAQGNQALANQGVVNATGGTFAPRAAQIGANGQVIDAQAQQTAAQRAAIQQNQTADAQRLAAEQGVQAAAANTADLTATAQAQNAQNNEAYKYQLAGLSQPVAVNTPNGASANLPAGTTANLQSQAQLLTTQQSQAEKLRAIKLDQAQQIVALAGTDVAGAQQAAARVGLTVAQAQLLVDQAQNNAAQAGVNVQQAQNKAAQAGVAVDQGNLGVTQAGLGLDAANLGVYNAATGVQQAAMPPAGIPAGYVVYTNPFTGQSNYMSAAAAQEVQYKDKQQIDAINQGQYGGLGSSSVTSLFYNGLVTGNTTVDEAHALTALTGITGSPQAAAALIADAKSRAQAQLAQQAADPKNMAAMKAYGKPYAQLTPEQKVSDQYWNAYGDIIASQYG